MEAKDSSRRRRAHAHRRRKEKGASALCIAFITVKQGSIANGFVFIQKEKAVQTDHWREDTTDRVTAFCQSVLYFPIYIRCSSAARVFPIRRTRAVRTVHACGADSSCVRCGRLTRAVRTAHACGADGSRVRCGQAGVPPQTDGRMRRRLWVVTRILIDLTIQPT